MLNRGKEEERMGEGPGGWLGREGRCGGGLRDMGGGLWVHGGTMGFGSWEWG